MKFWVTWNISQDKWLPVLKTFTSMSPKERADAGEGVKIIVAGTMLRPGLVS